MPRYRWGARVYDLLSMERLGYRPGRRAAIDGLRLRAGDRVLDVGCGTGLNLPYLVSAIGAAGEVVGVDAAEQTTYQVLNGGARPGGGRDQAFDDR
jgi:ubiquinone/menaquinone biosynthesis C-methylase UbiE